MALGIWRCILTCIVISAGKYKLVLYTSLVSIVTIIVEKLIFSGRREDKGYDLHATGRCGRLFPKTQWHTSIWMFL